MLGIIGSEALPKPGVRGFKILLTGINLIYALDWRVVIGITSTALGSVVMLLIGLGSGYQTITFFTAMQKRVPPHLLGRLMSLVLLFNIGLIPISQALARAVIKWSLAGLFGTTGVFFFLLVIWASFQPEFQMAGEILAARPSEK